MQIPPQDSPETTSHERKKRSLSARLGMGAKVGSYLAVLITSNVRAMLRRKGKGAHEFPHEKE
jgi:hypothetical protein